MTVDVPCRLLPQRQITRPYQHVKAYIGEDRDDRLVRVVRDPDPARYSEY